MGDGLFILGIIVTLVALWLGPSVVVGILTAGAYRQIARLRAEVASLRGEGSVAPAPSPILATAPEPAAPAVAVSDPDPPVDEEPAALPVVVPAAPPVRPWASVTPERLVVWVAASLGGLALVVAALLALVAVIERGWVGPAARVGGGMCTGIALWAAGAVLRTRSPWPASALSGAGAGALYGALWGATGLYDLVPSWVGGLGMVAVTTVAMTRAVRLSDRFVAHLGLLGGLLTPMLVSSGSDEVLSMFAYLGLLTAGVALVARRTGWWHLVVVVALGDVVLHVLWATGAYTPDQVGVALIGVGAMALPLALAAASRDRGVHLAAAIGAVAVAALAVPWLGPIDPLFVDPRTGQTLVRPSISAQWWAALAAVLLPVPLWLAGRWRGGASGAWGTLVATVAWIAFSGAWAGLADPSPTQAWLVAGVLGLGALGAAATSLGSATHARGLVPLALVGGLALALAVPMLPGAGVAVAFVAALGAAAVVAATSRRGVAPAVMVAGALPALWMMAADVDRLGAGWVAGCAVVALAVLAPGAVRVQWTRGTHLAWASVAAIAGVAFVPLRAAWVAGLGDAVIGLMPLGLAAVVLACAAALIRSRRLRLDDGVTAVLVAAILMGLAAAVPLQLETRWLTVAWALEAAALAAVSRRVRHPLIGVGAVTLCAAVGVRLLFNPWALSWGDAAGLPVLNWTLYAWGVPLVCVLAVARLLPRGGDGPDRFAWVPAPLGALAIALGFALVNVQVSHAFQDAGPLELGGVGRLQDMVRSVSWATYGIGVLGLGLWRDHRWVRLAGFAVVMLATAKVFTVDVWDLAGFVRVASVGGLAVALLVAAFLFERLVLRSSRLVEEA